MAAQLRRLCSVGLSALMLCYSRCDGTPGVLRRARAAWRSVRVRRVTVPSAGRKLQALVLSPKNAAPGAPAVLWLHGGGYLTGMKEMAFQSRALDLVTEHGAVVLAPDYTLSCRAGYPAALEDCWQALLYLQKNAAALGADGTRLIVGGESAGGGLCAAVCMRARDTGAVRVAFQLPLYPMLDDRPTPSSRRNFSLGWNTPLNRFSWRLYLRRVPPRSRTPYAVPARQTDYAGLPPAYTFVGTGEPFYCETLTYVEKLRAAGVEATADVFPYRFHATDMLLPWRPVSRTAIARFNDRVARALAQYAAPQKR